MKIPKFVKEIPLHHLILFEIILGLLGSVISFYLFAILTEDVLAKDTFLYDQIISNFIYSFRFPFLTKIMNIVTTIGDIPFFLSITAVILLFLIYKKHKIEVLIFSLTITIGGILNFLLKLLFHRTRPQLSPLFIEKDFSYPSGHAMNNFIFYGLLIFLFFRFTRKKKHSVLIGIVGIFWIGLIGFSRIYLGVHYPSDIIGGYLAGSWVILIALLIDKTITFRQGTKRRKE